MRRVDLQQSLFLFLLLTSLIAFSTLFGDWERVIGSSEVPVPPEKDIIKSDTSGLFIRTMVFGFTREDTTVDEKNFQRIEIPEEYLDIDTTRAGKPQIPYIRLLIAVPDSCECNISIYPSDYKIFENYFLYSVPGVSYGDTNGYICYKEVFVYDTSFYEKDTIYPGEFYEIDSDGHWRDQRVLEVFLYPVQFNPQKKLMYFYHRIDLRIEYSGEVVENENGLGPFEDLGREILLNYPGIDKEPPPHDPPAVHYYTDLLDTNNVADYIIVTHGVFLDNKTTQGWIQDFAEWRVDHNQFDVGIVKMADVYEEFLIQFPPDSAKALRDFLIYAYNNWHSPSMPDGHFAYCLFIGDWDYVPTKLHTYTFNSETWLGAKEQYFRSLITGSKDDIMLGRWPVKITKVQDLVTIAQKTINYEQSPTLGDWRRKGFLIAGEWIGMDSFDALVFWSRPYFTDISYSTLETRYSQIQNDSLFREAIDTNLNAGEIFTAYFDHGAPGAWWAYDTLSIKQLKNNAKLPVVLSAACLTAMFQWDHPFYDSTPPPGYPAGISFGEHFLIKQNGGAVAFWGATRITTNYSLTCGRLALERMLRYQDWILGKSLINLHYHYCLLGDPALDLGDYTAYPDLPDLVIRPAGTDISLLSPYPYPASGDTIPIRAAVWNIGAAAAYNIKIKIAVVEPGNDTVYIDTMRVDTILPRDSKTVTIYWDTGLTYPNYYGEIGDCKFIATVDPDDVIEESWEYNNSSRITKKVVFYPQGWSKRFFNVGHPPQPSIGNLDGEGRVEIVCPGFDSVYVLDSDGNAVSPWPKYFEGVYSVVLGDINNNGFMEVVAVSPESIKVFNYQGIVLSGWPQAIPASGYVFDGFPALGRVEDGVSNMLNIAVAARITSKDTVPIKIFVYDYQGLCVHELNTPLRIIPEFSGISIGDIVSGGNDEVVISFTSKDTVKSEIYNCNGFVGSLDYGCERMLSALVDINNDNYADVITGGVDGKIRAYDVENDMLLWERQTGGPINSSPAVGDIHPREPGVEVTFGNDASEIHLRRGGNGIIILPWEYTITPSTLVRTSPAIGNINGDDYLDIIIGANDKYLYAFKHTKEVIPPFPLPLFGIPSSPIIGDIDGDGKSEIIISSSDGYLHMWENMDSSVAPYTLEWPQFHHDYQRTGLYGW
jgi:hypothetical protein